MWLQDTWLKRWIQHIEGKKCVMLKWGKHTQKERKKDSWAMRDFRDVCMKSVPLADVCCFTCAQSTCVHTHTHTPYMPNAAMHCLSVQRSIVSFRNGIQSEAARHTHTTLPLYIIYWPRNCSSCSIVIESADKTKRKFMFKKKTLALYHYLQAALMKLPHVHRHSAIKILVRFAFERQTWRHG